jgi:hypothetical protein
MQKYIEMDGQTSSEALVMAGVGSKKMDHESLSARGTKPRSLWLVK